LLQARSYAPSARSFSGNPATSPGRKYTFLVTILIMGLSTSLVGVLPGSATIGLWYPIVIAVATFIIGLITVPETKDRDITNLD
jgi:hypothetical protein